MTGQRAARALCPATPPNPQAVINNQEPAIPIIFRVSLCL